MRARGQLSCRATWKVATLLAAVAIVPGSVCQAARAAPASVDAKAHEQAVSRAIDYLRTKGQADDGSFSAQAGPAVTALVATAMLRSGRTLQDPTVAKALAYLQNFVQPDGGVYKHDSNYKNYETCLAILCFAEAKKSAQDASGARFDEILERADKYVKGLQWDESEGHDLSSTNYGGAGYGGHARPDLSNTSFFMEALAAAGNGPDDEAVQRALLFVSRCQNLETEYNTTPFAAKNPDGGFYYTPAAGGTSQAGTTENGGLRSYGSMTYAGLKSMIYAGVDRDDQRVQAAVAWLRKNYDLGSNPGMGTSGLYYYYHTLAKALDAYGEPEFADAAGSRHDWRAELAGELVARQQADGSWTNENVRWLEGDANLVTGYALLTLSYCRP